MKKNTVKTSVILAAYNVISTAKYGKMKDDGKVKVWKISRKMKPFAVTYDEECKDAAEKLRPSEDFTDRLQKAQEYERLRSEKQPTIDVMTDADYEAFIAEFKKYDALVAKAVREFGDKEVEIAFDALTEEEFGQFMASNDWNMSQVVMLGDIICE